jgi:hypothetical protein
MKTPLPVGEAGGGKDKLLILLNPALILPCWERELWTFRSSTNLTPMLQNNKHVSFKPTEKTQS